MGIRNSPDRIEVLQDNCFILPGWPWPAEWFRALTTPSAYKVRGNVEYLINMGLVVREMRNGEEILDVPDDPPLAPDVSLDGEALV